jgi:hypothetical protein
MPVAMNTVTRSSAPPGLTDDLAGHLSGDKDDRPDALGRKLDQANLLKLAVGPAA